MEALSEDAKTFHLTKGGMSEKESGVHSRRRSWPSTACALARSGKERLVSWVA